MLGMNQRGMGEVLGISAQAYSMKERGMTSFSDEEKRKVIKIINKVAADETIGSIFFNEPKTKKDAYIPSEMQI
jgi:DNA-binding XRE family transcriptional regulator